MDRIIDHVDIMMSWVESWVTTTARQRTHWNVLIMMCGQPVQSKLSTNKVGGGGRRIRNRIQNNSCVCLCVRAPPRRVGGGWTASLTWAVVAARVVLGSVAAGSLVLGPCFVSWAWAPLVSFALR